MTELEQALYDLALPLVDDKASLSVRTMDSLNERDLVIFVYAKSEDIARLIGRKGSMATALRQMMSLASHSENKHVTLKFEALEV